MSTVPSTSSRPSADELGAAIAKAIASAVPGWTLESVTPIDEWVVEVRGWDPLGPVGAMANLNYPPYFETEGQASRSVEMAVGAPESPSTG